MSWTRLLSGDVPFDAQQPPLSLSHVAASATVELRNPATQPLSELQSAVVKELDRPEEQGKDAGPPAWQEAMPPGIIGIAAAMQSTG